MRRCALLAGTIWMLGVAASFASSIGIYPAADCSFTHGSTMVPPGPYTLYVVVHTYYDLNEFTGAEFKIVNFPPEWTVLANASTAATAVIGNPLDGTGVDIAFPTCQPGPCKDLFTLLIFPTSDRGNVYPAVRARTPPTNVNFQCPVLIACDAPVYTAHCAAGGTWCINAPCCDIAAEPRTWTEVKALYD